MSFTSKQWGWPDVGDTFTIPNETKPTLGDLIKAFEDLAQSGFQFLINSGLTSREAGSVVANIMLQRAWATAGAGRVLSGLGPPDPENFIAAARDQIATVRFTPPTESGQEA